MQPSRSEPASRATYPGQLGGIHPDQQSDQFDPDCRPRTSAGHTTSAATACKGLISARFVLVRSTGHYDTRMENGFQLIP